MGESYSMRSLRCKYLHTYLVSFSMFCFYFFFGDLFSEINHLREQLAGRESVDRESVDGESMDIM